MNWILKFSFCLYFVGNHCLGSMCSYLQMYYAGCCEQTGVFITQQLLLCPSPTFNHTKSLLQLTEQVSSFLFYSCWTSFVSFRLRQTTNVQNVSMIPLQCQNYKYLLYNCFYSYKIHE